jgi:hypothetical protein
VDLGKAIEPVLRGVGRAFVSFDSGAVVVRGEYVRSCRRANPPGPVLYSTPLFYHQQDAARREGAALTRHTPGFFP